VPGHEDICKPERPACNLSAMTRDFHVGLYQAFDGRLQVEYGGSPLLCVSNSQTPANKQMILKTTPRSLRYYCAGGNMCSDSVVNKILFSLASVCLCVFVRVCVVCQRDTSWAM